VISVVYIPTLACFLLVLAWISAALSDLRSMTIPNAISLAMVAGFVLFAPLSDMAWQTALYCLIAALLTFTVCFVLFAMNVMGGGDAKLLSASALWFGLSFAYVEFLVHTALFGGLLTLLVLFLRSKSTYAQMLSCYLPQSLTAGNKVPYGIAIAASGLVNLAKTTITQL
jgi:prepilin peptidase CpaA